MLKAGMGSRCPAAIPLGSAVLPEHRLVFRRWADVEPDKTSQVAGALWRIAPDCLAALDDYEEVEAKLYRRAMVTVATEAGAVVEAVIYRMTATTYAPPDPAYLAVVIEGCRDFGIDPKPVLDAADAACR